MDRALNRYDNDANRLVRVIYISYRSRRQMKMVLAAVLCIIVLIAISLQGIIIDDFREEPTPEEVQIWILKNEDFSNLSFPGSGTPLDPYRISRLNLSATHECIHIANTNCHFIINDCTFTSLSGSDDVRGVFLSNVSHGTIERSTFNSLRNGILVRNSSDCNISLCDFQTTTYPLALTDSSDCHLANNSIKRYGIDLQNCHSCSISSNTLISDSMTGWGAGIYVSESKHCLIVNNTLSGYGSGISISYATRIEIINNLLINREFRIFGSCKEHYNLTASGNILNGKKIGYFFGMNDTDIDGFDYGQIMMAYCENTTLQDGDFRNSFGVSLFHCLSCIILNTITTNNSYGVLIEHSSLCQLINITADNNWCGISIDASQSIELLNSSICKSIGNGILILNSYQCIVARNEVCHNDGIGIQLKGGAGANHTIIYNTIGSNYVYNAFDWGTDSSWDDGISCGNFWSDAIEGAVYPIPPGEGGVDHFPNGTAGTFTPTITNPGGADTAPFSNSTGYLDSFIPFAGPIIGLFLISFIGFILILKYKTKRH